MKTFNILAAEDEPLHAKMLAKKIELMEGYSLMHIFDTGEEVLKYCKLHGDDIDLILLDILLDGKWDGIETTKEIRKVRNVPIIFLTSLQDRSTFEKAKEGFPYAYLTKPFDVTDLQRAMELALQHSARQENPKENYFNDDTFFVRVGNKLVKLRWEEIAWLSVDGKYTRLNLGLGRGYEVRLPLKI